MATKTDKYELRKKEDNDFYNIDDFNDNMDKIETALTEFDDSGSADGITSFTDMLTKLVTGNKLAVTLRNLKAGLQFVLHAGSIVNNCVTDNAKLPLSAAQGKALQDAITKLNSDLWPWGFKTAFAVKDSSNANNLAIIRGYQNGAVSLGAENAPGTVYRRLQMNPDGTVVYYYKPDGVAIPKAVTLVSLSDLP